MENQKDFDTWNTRKKRINLMQNRENLYIHEREVWWSAVGVNIGTEMDGKNELFERPVLVLRKLGKDQFFGVPLTSKSKNGIFYIDVVYGEHAGTVCISQMRVFSVKRLLRKIGRIRSQDFKVVNTKISQLIVTGKV